ncbi:MAG: D-glycero-beta-D-manno-heptose 1,7-bisphosphate 7-phosphatase [Gammaproteobacteria bacterium]|nr:D-glycero-beta-D-manno-heptose 1,7-bisphosphate 7-phosphatase [Gammaproteobacteria bacterium]
MPLVLLDRDGVINYDSTDYILTPDQWRPLPGSIAAIARLKAAGFAVAVCTNQSAVGRGLIDEATLDAIHQRLCDVLGAQGAALDGIYFCPHAPAAGCDCRKPKPGLLKTAMAELGFAPTQTTMVGDSLRDVQAAIAAACMPVLVRTGHGARAEGAARGLGVDAIFDDLDAATDALVTAC